LQVPADRTMPRGRKPGKDPPLTSAERSKRWRERIKHKDKHQEYLKCERERWAHRRQEGGSAPKTVEEMTPREHRQKKKEWKQAKQRSKKAKVRLERDLPDTPPQSPQQEPERNNRVESGKKRRQKNRKKRSRKMKELKEKLEEEKRKNAALRVKLVRASKRSTTSTMKDGNNNDCLEETPETPRKRVERLVRENGININEAMKKRLTYQEYLLELVWKNTGFRFLTTRILRKYRGMRKWMKEGPLREDVRRSGERKRTGRKKLPLPVAEKVKAFWEREDVAVFTAGKKESITRNGVKMQRRYMTANGKELHRRYNNSTHFRVSYPSFMRMRPFYVLL